MDRLLFIRYRKPEKINEGGEQGSNINVSVLKKLVGENNVDTFYIHEYHSKKNIFLHAGAIFLNFLRGYYYGLSCRKAAQIVKLASAYSYVFIDRSIFGILAKHLKGSNYQGKIICFFHNVETVYFGAKIAKGLPWRPIVIACADLNDKLSCRYSDTIIALNQRDGKELEKRYSRQPDIYSPVVFRDVYKKPAYPQEKTGEIPVCLFLGTYFAMNVHGILWFIREVLPKVNIRLQVVGKGMNALRSSLSGNMEIEIFSDVPDLEPYIEQADFMLLPLFKGSGMKIKTCESLMYGKNIIGTHEAFEGYELDYDKAGALCNTKDEFIAAIQRFSTHPIPRFNAYCRTVYLEKYTEEARLERFSKLF